MTILLFVISGLIVGLLARAIVPGTQYIGVFWTEMLGIIGALVGGFLASIVSRQFVVDFNVEGLIGSVAGAMLILGIAGTDTAHHHPAH